MLNKPLKSILICLTATIIVGCTAKSKFTYHTRSSYINNDIEYDHPADVIYKKHQTYENYTGFAIYNEMRVTEREAVDHFLRSLHTCYSVIWEMRQKKEDKHITAAEFRQQRCDTTMGMYRELYRQGYDWRAIDKAGNDPVFNTLLTRQANCRRYSSAVARLKEHGEITFYCAGGGSSGGGSVNYWHGGSTSFNDFPSLTHYMAL